MVRLVHNVCAQRQKITEQEESAHFSSGEIALIYGDTHLVTLSKTQLKD